MEQPFVPLNESNLYTWRLEAYAFLAKHKLCTTLPHPSEWAETKLLAAVDAAVSSPPGEATPGPPVLAPRTLFQAPASAGRVGAPPPARLGTVADNRQALGHLLGLVSPPFKIHVSLAVTVVEAWQALHDAALPSLAAQALALDDEWSQLRMQSGESMPAWFARVTALRFRLAGAGVPKTEVETVRKLYIGLPSQFNALKLQFMVNLPSLSSVLGILVSGASLLGESSYPLAALYGSASASTSSRGPQQRQQQHPFRGFCNFRLCGKQGHKEADCRLKKKMLAAGQINADGSLIQHKGPKKD